MRTEIAVFIIFLRTALHSLVRFATVSRSRCGRLQTGRMHFSIFLVYANSWSHTDINNIGYKTHRSSALTNYYRRSAITSIVTILDESFLFSESD